MTKRKTCFARKASWLAFGLIALAAISSAREETLGAPDVCPFHYGFYSGPHIPSQGQSVATANDPSGNAETKTVNCTLLVFTTATYTCIQPNSDLDQAAEGVVTLPVFGLETDAFRSYPSLQASTQYLINTDRTSALTHIWVVFLCGEHAKLEVPTLFLLPQSPGSRPSGKCDAHCFQIAAPGSQCNPGWDRKRVPIETRRDEG
jgi:hypothetical protein